MNYNDSHVLWIAYCASNIAGALLLWAALIRPRLARLVFFFLFGWASWVNYTTCHQRPEVYLDYAHFSIGLYKNFINSWFKDHITGVVSVIAIGQALIAIGMVLNGIWVKMACVGVILFLLAIAPLGMGSAFPFSITVSLAAYFIIRKDDKKYLWKTDNPFRILTN